MRKGVYPRDVSNRSSQPFPARRKRAVIRASVAHHQATQRQRGDGLQDRAANVRWPTAGFPWRPPADWCSMDFREQVGAEGMVMGGEGSKTITHPPSAASFPLSTRRIDCRGASCRRLARLLAIVFCPVKCNRGMSKVNATGPAGSYVGLHFARQQMGASGGRWTRSWWEVQRGFAVMK